MLDSWVSKFVLTKCAWNSSYMQDVGVFFYFYSSQQSSLEPKQWCVGIKSKFRMSLELILFFFFCSDSFQGRMASFPSSENSFYCQSTTNCLNLLMVWQFITDCPPTVFQEELPLLHLRICYVWCDTPCCIEHQLGILQFHFMLSWCRQSFLLSFLNIDASYRKLSLIHWNIFFFTNLLIWFSSFTSSDNSIYVLFFKQLILPFYYPMKFFLCLDYSRTAQL